MFEKISIEEIYPNDYEELLKELHEEEFPCDEYFGATVEVIDLETGFQHTILLSAWYEIDEKLNHNFILLNQ